MCQYGRFSKIKSHTYIEQPKNFKFKKGSGDDLTLSQKVKNQVKNS